MEGARRLPTARRRRRQQEKQPIPSVGRSGGKPRGGAEEMWWEPRSGLGWSAAFLAPVMLFWQHVRECGGRTFGGPILFFLSVWSTSKASNRAGLFLPRVSASPLLSRTLYNAPRSPRPAPYRMSQPRKRLKKRASAPNPLSCKKPKLANAGNAGGKGAAGSSDASEGGRKRPPKKRKNHAASGGADAAGGEATGPSASSV